MEMFAFLGIFQFQVRQCPANSEARGAARWVGAVSSSAVLRCLCLSATPLGFKIPWGQMLWLVFFRAPCARIPFTTPCIRPPPCRSPPLAPARVGPRNEVPLRGAAGAAGRGLEGQRPALPARPGAWPASGAVSVQSAVCLQGFFGVLLFDGV